MVPQHRTGTIALLCSASVCLPQFSFWVLPTILLLVLPTILLGFGQKAGAASAVSTIPGLPSRKTAKPAFPLPSTISNPVFPLFPAHCFPPFSPCVFLLSTRCTIPRLLSLQKCKNTHRVGKSTKPIFSPANLNPVILLSFYQESSRESRSVYLIFKTSSSSSSSSYSDGNLGGNLLL